MSPWDGGCKHPEVVEVVTQGLRGGNCVDDCNLHDDLVHEGGILHVIEGVLGAKGEQLCCRISRE